jgi:hypothetical protein
MPPITSPSASACTSSSCRPQNSAICRNERPVFSIIQSAVALGIIGWDMGFSFGNGGFIHRFAQPVPASGIRLSR